MKPHNPSKTNSEILTLSQTRVADRITAYADTHFAVESWTSAIKPQTSILIAGPTGTGKSFSVRLAAKRAGAHYFQATYGTWVPLGADAGIPTLCQIGSHLLQFDRCVLHLDELDKFEGADSSWTQSCRNDLFQLLDKHVNWTSVTTNKRFVKKFDLKNDAPAAKPPTLAELAVMLDETTEQRLMIVGSGTWQRLFEEAKSPLGFTPSAAHCVALDQHSRIAGLSPELRRRFHNEVQYLDYPDREETKYLLDAFGLTEFALQLDYPLLPNSIDWPKMGGLTALTSLHMDLLIASRQRHFGNVNEVLSSELT